MFALNETKIYGAKMKQMLDEKARVIAPVRNGEAAGSNPAESIFIYEGACMNLLKASYLPLHFN